MGYFRNKITESEFTEALGKCSKIASEAYKQTLKYQQEVEGILQKLNVSLRENTSELLNDKDAEHFEFTEVLKNVIKFKKQSQEGLKDLKNATEVKRQYLKDFTIALFGRTKAGKSSIRESLTRNGDGSTIGLGKLHNTKEVGDYKWKGLRILDTPGVEGYGGEVEASKAHDIIDQSDVIIFLTTDETQQPGEFDEMERLIEINKPFFIVLNIKDKLTEPAYLDRFLKDKGNLFNDEIIEENKQRIFSETKRIGIRNIKIIWISALASCISQFAERGFAIQDKTEFINSIKHPQIRDITRWILDNLNIQDVHRMWQLSQMDKVYEYIAYEVNSNGMQLRVLTFYDSTINFIDTIAKMLSWHQHSLRAHAEYMVEKREKLSKFFERFIEESNLKIERKCEELFNPIKEWIPNFIDEYLGQDNAQSVLKREFNKEKKKSKMK
jgi:tRNA U34 5-carboxymethylaminomethyl modifying GTPase MnmE/TrmE